MYDMSHMNTNVTLSQNDASIELQRHIKQNNDRLRCIQKHLQNPQGFQQAAKELLEWCSDPRAYQKSFEASLMDCLTVISDVSSKPGFDLSLGYRLLATCAANKHKFSMKSSNMLQCWSNELGNLLLLQRQKQNPNEDLKHGQSPGPHMVNGPGYGPPPPLAQQRYPNPQWNNGNRSMMMSQGGPIPPRPQQSAVSVITTVWGVTNTQQSQHATQDSMNNNNPYNTHALGHMSGNHGMNNNDSNYNTSMNSYSGPPTNKMGSYGPKNDLYHRQDSFGSGNMNHKPMNGMPYGPNKVYPSHHMGHDNAEYPQPAAAAAAAAVAAAAATATATATATLIANDQQQQQHNDMNNYDSMINPGQGGSYQMPPGPPNDMHRPLHAVHSGGGPHPGMDMRGNYNQQPPMQRGHPRPPIPADYGPHGQPDFPVSGQNNGIPRNNFPGVSQQFRGPSYRHRQPSYPQYNGPGEGVDFKSPTGPHSVGYNSRTPLGGNSGSMHHGADTMYPNSSSAPPGQFFPGNHHQSSMHPPMAGPNYNRPSFGPQFSSFRGGSMQNSPSPISTNNVPPYHGPDIKPMIPPSHLDIKPSIPMCSDPPMSAGPINDVKPSPSQLQNALMTTENDDLRLTFPVRDGIVIQPFRLEHNLPHSRPDLELQFKCYHHEDRMSYTNWPHSVQVRVNDTPLTIPRAPVHRPLSLKNVCKEGKNIISISVQTCCCSHLFVLQLVHRPSVHSVIKGLLQKRLLPAEHCITKIRRLFHNDMTGGVGNSPMNNNIMDGNNSIKISLLCPITLRRIELPARGHDCKHIQCFDLSAYLQLNCDKGSWTCPVCKKTALLEGLEVDQYTWTILHHMQEDSGNEVTIDANCTWRPIHIKQEVMVKEEPDAPPSKRFKSGMSPSTMLAHLPSPGSYVPMMTPLPPRKSQPIMDGQGFNNNPTSYPGCGMSSTHAGSVMQNRSSMAHQPINKTLSMSELGDNIAANDKVLIERRINHAVTNANMLNSPMNPQTPQANTPGTPMRPPSHPNGPVSHNSSHQSNTMPGTPGPNTPGGVNAKPPTPGVGMSPSITNRRNESEDSTYNKIMMPPSSTSSTIKGSLPYDADLVINGEAIGENNDAIPSLDILPENTDPMEILSFLDPSSDGTAPTTSAEDLYDLFDT